MSTAAGILFIAPGNRALFLKRGSTAPDHPSEWCFPGGHADEGETALQTALRETLEETGYDASSDEVTLLTRAITPNTQTAVSPAAVAPAPGAASLPVEPGAGAAPETTDFTTFAVRLKGEFTPLLCEEHTGYAWAPISEPPQPMHPGCQIALDRLDMDELGVAEAMAAGRLTSPQTYKNVTLWAMRITGTGVSYRSGLKEFVWRDPAVYLNDRFLKRCNGLAVIWEHPKKAVLDSQEYSDRNVGSIMVPYINGNEVWGIAKVYDAAANGLMAEGRLSTSPSVVLSATKGDNTKMLLDDGTALLIEGEPVLLDHLAVCEHGVWDKGGEPTGILNDSTGDLIMADEDKTKEEERGDADVGTKLDKLLSFCDSMERRMDAIERSDAARRDAEEEAEEKMADKRKDGEGEDDKPAFLKKDAKKDGEEDDEPTEVVADKRKDGEGEEKEEAKDTAMADAVSEIVAENARLRARMADIERTMPRDINDADAIALADEQARADDLYHLFGDRAAPRPLQGETPLTYRRRVARDFQTYSKAWSGVNLAAMTDDAFAVADEQIRADARSAAMRPAEGDSKLRPIKRTENGHTYIEYVGSPNWMEELAYPGGARQYATRIDSQPVRH